MATIRLFRSAPYPAISAFSVLAVLVAPAPAPAQTTEPFAYTRIATGNASLLPVAVFATPAALPADRAPLRREKQLLTPLFVGAAGEQPPGQMRMPEKRGSVGRRILGGALGGVGGFFLGGYLGAKIEGNDCGCDDPGFKGFLIGAPIGAVSGAVAGAILFGK
jgi:hypothetical protein